MHMFSVSFFYNALAQFVTSTYTYLRLTPIAPHTTHQNTIKQVQPSRNLFSVFCVTAVTWAITPSWIPSGATARSPGGAKHFHFPAHSQSVTEWGWNQTKCRERNLFPIPAALHSPCKSPLMGWWREPALYHCINHSLCFPPPGAIHRITLVL